MEKTLSTKADAKALFAKFNKSDTKAVEQPEPEVQKPVKAVQKPDKAAENREMLEKIRKEALAEMEAEKQPPQPTQKKKSVVLEIPDKLDSFKESAPEMIVPDAILNNEEYVEMFNKITLEQQQEVCEAPNALVRINKLRKFFAENNPDEKIETVKSEIDIEIENLKEQIKILKLKKSGKDYKAILKADLEKAATILLKLAKNPEFEFSDEVDLWIARLQFSYSNNFPTTENGKFAENSYIAELANHYHDLLEPEPENEDEEPEED